MKLRTAHKNACFGLSIVGIMIFVSAFCSCGEKPKPQSAKKASLKPTLTAITGGRLDSISLFNLDLTETRKGDTAGFVSVSDIDRLPGTLDTPADSLDSLVIPDLKNKKPEETQYLNLNGKYRARLLAGTRISETDSLFAYDYSNDKLLAFPIRSLKAVASLSPYEDEKDIGLHSTRDYMLGFEIKRAALKRLNEKYFGRVLVYIGASNPFIKGQMHAVIWQKIDPQNIPSISPDNEEKRQLKDFKLSGTYSFTSGGLRYYLLQFSKHEATSQERLLITNADNKLLFTDLYYENESVSPAELSFAGNNKNELQQWTGRLLKNKPPLILGFEDVSFGCPSMSYIDGSNDYILLQCDNRH